MRLGLIIVTVALTTACEQGGIQFSDVYGSEHSPCDTGDTFNDAGDDEARGPLGQPVLYFPFDECSDTTPEAMGTGLDASLIAASCGAENALGDALGGGWLSGTALACSGGPNSACASAPDDPLFEPGEFTISAWVASADWSACGGGHCTIVSKGNTDNAPRGYWLAIIYGTPRLNVQGNGGETSVMATDPLSPNTWHHLTATFDGHTGTLYVDGAVSRSGQIPRGLEYGHEDFLIGAIANRNYVHNGHIDEVMLWDSAMTEAEVAELYDSYVGDGM